MVIQEIALDRGVEKISEPQLGSVELRGTGNAEGRPCDITVSAFGREVTLHQFAPCLPKHQGRPKSPFFVPFIVCALGNESSPFLAVAGLRSLLVVNFAQMTIGEALPFYRKANEDQGFYHLDLLPWNDGLVVLYESGVALLDRNGKAVWHQALTWNDVLLRRDEANLYFVGENPSGTHKWKISIVDGTKQSLTECGEAA